MSHLAWYWRFLIWSVCIGGPGYVLWLFLSAYLEVKAQPREAMFWCTKHGMMRKKDCISFMGMDYCILCWHERVKSQEKVR